MTGTYDDTTCRTSYDVIVIGGGAGGLNAALVLARARRTVAVVDAGEPRNAPSAHMHSFLSRDGVSPLTVLETGRAEIGLHAVELADGRTLECGAVFLFPGMTPNDAAFEDLGCERDEQGWLVTDGAGRTSAPSSIPAAIHPCSSITRCALCAASRMTVRGSSPASRMTIRRDTSSKSRDISSRLWLTCR